MLCLIESSASNRIYKLINSTSNIKSVQVEIPDLNRKNIVMADSVTNPG